METTALKVNSPTSKSQMLMENSDWLAENVKGLDQSVKDMLQLIEHGELLEDDKNPKQQELIAYIKEISHRHHLLSDRYKELSSHVQTANETNNVENAHFGLQSPSLVTPDKKIQIEDAEVQAVDSDLSLSSGSGISDTTPNEGSESSSLLSDSDSETYYQTPYENSLSRSHSHAKPLKHEIADLAGEESEVDGASTKQGHNYEMLLSRISEYEQEVDVSNLKLQLAEEEITTLKKQLDNNEVALVKMGNLEAELESAKNQIKLHEAELEKESKRSLMLQGQIVDLETKLSSEKKQAQDLKDTITKYATIVSDRDFEIQKLNAELQDNSGGFALEKWQLESCNSKLSEDLSYYKTRTNELEMEYASLYEKVKNLEAEKDEMEGKHEALRKNSQDYTLHVEAELSNKNEVIGTMNKKYEGLNLKYDQVIAERDELQTKLQTLEVQLSVHNNQIQTLEQNLCELLTENKQLVAESENANKVIPNLNSRIAELENELGTQSIVISDRAEEKREAIRQLCFSIDHYKNAYGELRDAYLMQKRRRARAS